MPYELRFSDSSNTSTVIVPDMPPGINTVDTSLKLVGRGYPNYGEVYAENFLHLLENFAGPTPPENPIEGQLWYDTSDTNRKVLRVMDGTASAARWPNATGIYQQATDPSLSPVAGLKNGDLWVDTSNNQLKLYSYDAWITVGPSVGTLSKTGAEIHKFIDAADANLSYYCILNWANGYVVSVVSAVPEFTPATYPSGMQGFTTIKPGITMTTRQVASTSHTFYGTAENSNKLGSEAAANYLLKNDSTTLGQQITGKVTYVTPSTAGSQGRDGVLIRVSGTASSEYIQFYKDGSDAVIYNNKSGGKVNIKTYGATLPRVSVEKDLITVNTNTTVTGNLTVNTSASINSLSVTNNLSVGGKLSVSGNVSVNGITTITNTLFTGNVRASTSTNTIGTKTVPYQNIHAVNVYAQNYLEQPGTLRLWAGSTVTNTLPEGWMYCTGTSISTSTYSDLFSVIGYHYGGSGSSFYIPSLFVTSTQGAVTTNTYYIIKI